MNKEEALNYLVMQINEKLRGKKDELAPAAVPDRMNANSGFGERLAVLANEKLHGTPAPDKSLMASYDPQAGVMCNLINVRLHGEPAQQPAAEGQDQAWKDTMAKNLLAAVKEREDEEALDEEIARFNRDLARERSAKRQNRASAVMKTKTGHARLTPDKKFWRFKNQADNQAELLLYGEIQSERSWLDDPDSGGVYADEFVQDLRDLGNVSQITCRINSAGGDIFAAIAIYTQLKTHAARIVCIIDGLAASAATLIVMAGDEIQMPIGAMQMIHDPLACLCGIYNAEDLEKIGETLDTIKESIVSVYANRTGLSTGKVENLMTAESWMDVDEAIKLGFCDTKIGTAIQAEMKGHLFIINNVKHDLSKFKTQPKAKSTSKPDPNDTGEPDPDETDNPGTVDKGDGPACDDCDGARCGGCPCLDCDEEDCDDCNEASHTSEKMQERAAIGGFIAESANKILHRRAK
jgi:ATP-dependent protease ClpP protease subunit